MSLIRALLWKFYDKKITSSDSPTVLSVVTVGMSFFLFAYLFRSVRCFGKFIECNINLVHQRNASWLFQLTKARRTFSCLTATWMRLTFSCFVNFRLFSRHTSFLTSRQYEFGRTKRIKNEKWSHQMHEKMRMEWKEEKRKKFYILNQRLVACRWDQIKPLFRRKMQSAIFRV